MANLVCFPHYTCGALMCDIMLNKMSPMGANGAIQSIEHKQGKINDTDTISTVDPQKFQNRINYLRSNNLLFDWIGTHAWPGQLPIEQFDKVLVITTATNRSKIYRWSRAYRHYFLPTWGEMAAQDLVDKARETAKNYLIPFDPVFADNVVNLEFADVVDCTAEFMNLIQGKDYQNSLSRWQEVNSFLRASDFWNSNEVKFFYQAEVEQQLKKYYVYN
jgi:hypothetical protein